MKRQYWFKRKTYGWGWTPATWQGWLAIGVWAIGFIFSIMNFDHEWIKNVLVLTLLTFALLFICFKKGESPKWQWGEH